jgi:DNA-binding SARP family transcriptional activator/adenylate kinase
VAKLDPVVRHAITPPAFDETKVHRDRLVDQLHANVPRKLIAIAAPPGYGKTTLLSDFSANTELPVCWVRITTADQDVYRFVNVFNESLKKRFRRLSGKIELEKLFGTPPESLGRIFAETIDEHIAETFVIVLDDVHLINSSKGVTTFLDSLLEVQPDQVTILAAGREVLEVSLARLMANGALAGLGPQDLALNPEEIVELAQQQSGLSLTEDHAARLFEETKGWVTGLILSGELSGKDLPSLVFESRPMVYEYLASVVLNRQPDTLRRFMLDSAVFPVMTAAACDTVLERKDSAEILIRLLREGLFVSATNESPRTFEYHPQFREFLLDSAGASDQERLIRLQKLAARYLESEGAGEQAMSLYITSGEYTNAAELAESQAQTLYQMGRWQTLKEWGSRLEGKDAPVPQVHLYIAQNALDQGHIEQAESSLEQAHQWVDDDSPKYLQALLETIRGQIAMRQKDYKAVHKALDRAEELLHPAGSRMRKAQCLRLRADVIEAEKGDLEAALELVDQAVELLQDTESQLVLANTYLDRAYLTARLGDFIEAHSSNVKAHEILVELGAPEPLARSFNNLANDALNSGSYLEALELYSEGLKRARRAASPIMETNILYGQADLFSDLDLALQAAEIYGQALTISSEIDHPRLIRYGCVQTSVLHRRRDSLALANQWLARAIELEAGSNPEPSVQIQLAAIEANVHPEKALETFSRFDKDPEGSDVYVKTLAKYFIARTHYLMDDMDLARQVLEAALDWAGANGTEHLLAGEFAHDALMREFGREQLGQHPVFVVVSRRVESMRALAQQYKDSADQQATPDTLSFQALGASVLHSGDLDIMELKPLAREVLFFIIDRERVEREQLLETFWPHHPAGRQVSNLHTALYSLRRLLGKETIVHDGAAYALNSELSTEYDVARFERASEVAESLPPGDPRRLFALTEAIHSYRGPFLPEFSSDWVLDRRRFLELRYLDLLSLHAQEALVRDQASRAVQTLRQALEIDPLRDDTNLHYLEALGRLGRRSEAVDHYQRYVRLLADELGLDPPEEVRKLYTRLLG